MIMKLLNAFILIQLFIFSSLSAQNYKPSKEKLLQSLTDEVFIFTLFVNTQNDTWDDDEKEYYLGQLEKSQNWLIDQASNYDQELEFNNDFFFDNNETVYVENVNRYSGLQRTIKAIMEDLGHDDFNDFVKDNDFDFENDKLKLLLFVKSNSRSHAYNQWSNKEVDLAIVYCKHTNGMFTDHLVISHEILHQFGAWDLYQGRSQSVENAKELKNIFPHSVMIDVYRNKSRKEIDELTAHRIGWVYEYKEEYRKFDPRVKGNSSSEKKVKSYKFNLRNKKN